MTFELLSSRVGRALAVISLAVTLLHLPAPAWAQQEISHRDLVYAVVDGRELRLDLHLPAGIENPPLLVWVHGGAWRTGSKESVPMGFVRNGIATASVDFRQTPEAPFPANVHDIRAAIRYLRAVADQYGFRADAIAIAGNSSGGHLAALVGVTNGHPDLEGTVGDHPDRSSDVHAIISYYGASNLTSILAQSTPFGLGIRVPALDLLLGAQPDEAPELAQLASPVLHVDPTDPPLLLFHGDQDPQMPINQAHELVGAFGRLGLDVSLHVLHGVAHGGPEFFDAENLRIALDFLARVIGTAAP
jgi:acetyl esterase/lipase